MDLTPEKNVLYANKIGASLINLKGELLWSFEVEKGEELHTAYRLKNGNYLLGICGHPARFLELSKSGKVLKETKFETGIENTHGQFRRISKNKKGNYIAALWGRHAIVEVSPKGKLLNEIKVRKSSFAITELKNGNYLISCGDSGILEEINPATKALVRTIENSTLTGEGKILFAATAEELPNGDILLANWNGHSKDKSQPKLLQINRENKIVWSLKDDPEIANISALKVLK